MFLTTSASDESYDFRWWISITVFSVLTRSKYLLFRSDDCIEVMLLSSPFPVRRMGRSSVLWSLISIDWQIFVVLMINYPKYLKAIQRLHEWRLKVHLRHLPLCTVFSVALESEKQMSYISSLWSFTDFLRQRLGNTREST